MTSSVMSNQLKFRQTSDFTWEMDIPATYPCVGAGTNCNEGFKFIVGDDEGYTYEPGAAYSLNTNTLSGGTFVKSASKREPWAGWNPAKSWEVCTTSKTQLNPYNYTATENPIVMDGYFTIKVVQNNQQDAENSTYSYTFEHHPEARVAYAATNIDEPSAYTTAQHTTFLYAPRESNGRYSNTYSGKLAIETQKPTTDPGGVYQAHNGLFLYTNINEAYADRYDADQPWLMKKAQDDISKVSNSLGTRGISGDDKNLFQNGGNFEAPFSGSCEISTTFFYGKNNHGYMEEALSESTSEPLVGAIRTYSTDRPMKERYNVKTYIATGYDTERKSFILKKLNYGYIPAGVGVVLYTDDETVDILRPDNDAVYEGKAATAGEVEARYGKNYLVPTLKQTSVSTYSYKPGSVSEAEFVNFFLAKLKSAKDYNEKDFGATNYWGFFSVLNTQYSKANRAYLHYPYTKKDDRNFEMPGTNIVHLLVDETSAGAKGAPYIFVDDDSETTGISDIPAATTKANDGYYYSLDGRCVQNPQKGIYIQNGKKYIFK
ncbi:hypothetical protein SAMN05216383_12143 [Prevotella sp. KH2C16]|nr:hypothetical protein SAMN05216383_12143 [Prevotella sp. KH2C16]